MDSNQSVNFLYRESKQNPLFLSPLGITIALFSTYKNLKYKELAVYLCQNGAKLNKEFSYYDENQEERYYYLIEEV